MTWVKRVDMVGTEKPLDQPKERRTHSDELIGFSSITTSAPSLLDQEAEKSM